jgi:hypothetical protein
VVVAGAPLTVCSEGACKHLVPAVVPCKLVDAIGGKELYVCTHVPLFVSDSGAAHASRACEPVDTPVCLLDGFDEPAEVGVPIGHSVSSLALTPFVLTSCTKCACVYFPMSGRKSVGHAMIEGFVARFESASSHGTVLCLVRSPLKVVQKKQQHNNNATTNATWPTVATPGFSGLCVDGLSVVDVVATGAPSNDGVSTASTTRSYELIAPAMLSSSTFATSWVACSLQF